MVSKFCIVIGAPKSATTTLVTWLASRPDMATHQRGKEPVYFTDFAERTWTGPHADFAGLPWAGVEEYLHGFGDVEWGVDGSTDYLWNEDSAERIADFARGRHVRLIAVLRDPVDRAYSEWQHTVRDGYETENFRRSLNKEPERRLEGWHPLCYHAARSRYHLPLQRYFDRFGDDLLLIDQADFKRPEAVWDRVQAFLGISGHRPDFGLKLNQSYQWRSASLRDLLHDRRRLARARRILPSSFKSRAYSLVARSLKTRGTMTRAEEAAIFALIQDDVRACLADMRIPTSGWARSRRLAGD